MDFFGRPRLEFFCSITGLHDVRCSYATSFWGFSWEQWFLSYCISEICRHPKVALRVCNLSVCTMHSAIISSRFIVTGLSNAAYSNAIYDWLLISSTSFSQCTDEVALTNCILLVKPAKPMWPGFGVGYFPHTIIYVGLICFYCPAESSRFS